MHLEASIKRVFDFESLNPHVKILSRMSLTILLLGRLLNLSALGANESTANSVDYSRMFPAYRASALRKWASINRHGFDLSGDYSTRGDLDGDFIIDQFLETTVERSVSHRVTVLVRVDIMETFYVGEEGQFRFVFNWSMRGRRLSFSQSASAISALIGYFRLDEAANTHPGSLD